MDLASVKSRCSFRSLDRCQLVVCGAGQGVQVRPSKGKEVSSSKGRPARKLTSSFGGEKEA